MPNTRGPTLRSQWLGKKLRELREEANLTLRDVAQYVQRDASSVSRMESGIHPARIPDVLAYVTLCRIDDAALRDRLVQLAQDAWQTGLWNRDPELKDLMDLVWLEARATEIRFFEALVIPGLIQTPDYAAAVMRSSDATEPQAAIERWVELRIDRQRVLSRDKPLRLHAVLDEAVLHRVVGSESVMREQLLLLSELAERPNITISVLPWAAGAHASPEGCFAVLVMDEPYSDIGYMETAAGPVFVERDEAHRLLDRHARLFGAALDAGDSTALILSIAEELSS